MPRSPINNGQIVELVKQLPKKEKERIVRDMILREDADFFRVMETGKQKFAAFCRRRNVDPDRLSEEGKEALIDETLHEFGGPHN